MPKSPVDTRVLLEHVDRFPQAKVLVIGDIILDEYVWGRVSRISPEAPVPIVEVGHESKSLGGAANVAHNLAALGAGPLLCGVVGTDRMGRRLIRELEQLGLGTEGIVVEDDRPTSVKTRVVAHHQHVVRFDRETREPLTAVAFQQIFDFIEKQIGRVDVVIVADYGKGVVSAPLMKRLRSLVDATRGRVKIAVDPKTDNFEYYREVDVITPNHHEAGIFCRFDIVDDETLIRAGRQMIAQLDCRSVLITRGKLGMVLFENGMDITSIPTSAQQVFDVTGAGDTVIGTVSLGLATGLDLRSAAILSNLAAGIVVGEVGTSTVRAEALKQAIAASEELIGEIQRAARLQ